MARVQDAMRYNIAATNLGDVLQLGLTLFRNNARPACVLGLLFSLPQLLFFAMPLLLPEGEAGFTIHNVDGTTTTITMEALFGLGMSVFLLLVLHPLAKGAMTLLFTGDLMRQPLTWQEALALAWGRKFSLWVAELFSNILAGLGAVFFFAPGVYFILRYALTIQIVMLEGAKGPAALPRSAALMRGHYVMTFGLMVLLLGLNLALSTATTNASDAVGIAASWLLQGAMTALGTALFTALYFATRSKHEQFERTIANGPPRNGDAG